MRRLVTIFCALILAAAILFFCVFRLIAPYRYHYVCYQISNLSHVRLFSLFDRTSDDPKPEVPQASEEIRAWLEEEGLDTTIDPSYPDVTMTNLQGRWLWKNLAGQSEELFFEGTQCTVTIPFLNMEGETYDCAIINRSEEGLCPKLVIFHYPGETAGLTYYISEVKDTSFYCAAQQQIFYRAE